jgi:uncharacterized protein
LSIANENWLVPKEMRNRRRALYWARRAARSSDPRASLLLNHILLDPDSGESARAAIFAAYKGVAAAGDAGGQYSVGVCYEEGFGVPRDIEKALFWYTKAAVSGDKDAEAAVARLCARGVGGLP